MRSPRELCETSALPLESRTGRFRADDSTILSVIQGSDGIAEQEEIYELVRVALPLVSPGLGALTGVSDQAWIGAERCLDASHFPVGF
jgi:hypothetical protein